MMTLEQRIEANANLVLWCVHVLGPDEVFAAPSHAAAVEAADKANRSLWERFTNEIGSDVLCFAYADVWPWSAQAHAESLARQAEQTAVTMEVLK